MLTESPAYSGLFTSSLLSCSPQDGVVAPTPLIAASGKNHIEVARFLVKQGASIDYQNQVFLITTSYFLICLLYPNSCVPPQFGYSALQVACDRGNTDIIKLLIQSSANIELKNNVGFVLTIILLYIIHGGVTYRKVEQD